MGWQVTHRLARPESCDLFCILAIMEEIRAVPNVLASRWTVAYDSGKL
jgi:hypothetical protein